MLTAICSYALLVALFKPKQVQGKLIKQYRVKYHSPHPEGEQVPGLRNAALRGIPVYSKGP